MKFIFAFAAFVLAISPFALAEKISHAVREATVFTDRAVITRTGTAQLKRGRNEIIFDELPAQISTRSIRVGGNLSPEINVVGISWERHISASVDPALLAQTEEKLAAALAEKTRISDEISAAEARIKMLARCRETLGKSAIKNGEQATATTAGKISAEEQKNFKEIEEKSASLRKIEREISELEQLRKKISNGGNARRTVRVVVTLDSASECTAEIPIVYTTFSARWTPAYTLRVFPFQARATEFSCDGLVSQRTGEDWSGVRLCLSTARAQVAANPPQATTTQVSGEDVDPSSRQIVEERGNAISEVKIDALGATDETASEPAETSTEAPVVFQIEGVHSVKSGGNAQRVLIAETTLADVEFGLEAAPEIRPSGYLRATAKNGAPFPILAGTAELYSDAKFIGKTSLKYAPENAEFSFFGGNADGLSAACKTLPEFVEKDGGFFSKTKKGDRIKSKIYTISNKTDAAQKIRVRSQIAVSEIDDVKISILEKADKRFPATTAGYVLEKETGMLFWDIEIPAGETKDLALTTRTEHDE